MLAPPSASDLLSSIDTTKIRARQFSRATGREEVSKDTTLWTETPVERQKRLADELSGKRKRATADLGPSDDGLSSKRAKRDMEIREQVKKHNVRPVSLLMDSFDINFITDDLVWLIGNGSSPDPGGCASIISCNDERSKGRCDMGP